MTEAVGIIRAAVPTDAAGCAAVVNGWIDATGWMPRSLTHEEIAGHLRDAIGQREIWVIGDPIAGYISVDAAAARIGGFYCSRTGAGLGKALLDRAKRGRDYLWLHTHKPNIGAQRFYAREGFRLVAEVAPEPPETITELRYEWRR